MSFPRHINMETPVEINGSPLNPPVVNRIACFWANPDLFAVDWN
ncbi:MAG: hypothetical protein P4L33_00515 [Capsulimonadaceae bacterium]|nr:hypothetical protein [Capsulimonadaceae bacterium]